MMANNGLTDGDYVNAEAAIALMHVGYESSIDSCSSNYRGQRLSYVTEKVPGTGGCMVSRPLLQKAVEWLREHHKVSLRVNYSREKRNKYFFDYLDMEDGNYNDSTVWFDDSVGYYDSYNEAVNAGIVAICEYIGEQ